MKNILFVVFPILLLACKKDIPAARNSNGVTIYPPPPPPPPPLPTSIIIPGSVRVGNLSGPRVEMASVVCRDKFYYAADSIMDIFDPATNTTTIEHLSISRSSMAGVTAENKVLFAGGFIYKTYPAPHQSSSRVDIFNTDTKTWNTSELSVARYAVNACTRGTKIFFAGGMIDVYTPSARIDIYDITLNSWSSRELSYPGLYMSVMIGNKIWFIQSGKPIIDMYDVSTNSWSTGLLPATVNGTATITLQNKVYFIGNWVVSIYDISTGAWSSINLSENKFHIPVGISNNKLAFIGGMTNWGVYSSKIEIYDPTTQTWSFLFMNTDLYYASMISYNNFIYSAGGLINQENNMLSDIYRFSL